MATVTSLFIKRYEPFLRKELFVFCSLHLAQRREVKWRGLRGRAPFKIDLLPHYLVAALPRCVLCGAIFLSCLLIRICFGFQIDQLVYDLYSLTEEEIKIVESQSK